MTAEGGRRNEERQAAFSLVTGHWSLVTAFLLGAVTVLAYEPFGLFPLTILTLSALFIIWQRADSARAAARAGFA